MSAFDDAHATSHSICCQACVIGAGAAGIALALELGQQGMSVTLVTGGGREESPADRELNKGTIEPPTAHEPLEHNRHRAFGGGTKVWGGRLVPYDPIDFEDRPYVPHSGWPISYDDIAGHFGRAAELCEAAAEPFQQSSNAARHDFPDQLGDGTITTTSTERWSMPTDFAQRYQASLSKMENVRVLVDYHCVDLRLDDDQNRVQSVQLVSRHSPSLCVEADFFILATGGIENARLLLAARSQRPEGIGNHNDMVGRCYMGHVAGTYGRLCLNNKRKPDFYRLQKDTHGVYYRRRFQLSEQAQRENQVMNIIAFPFRPEPDDPSHRDAALSLAYFYEVLNRQRTDERPPWKVIRRHLANIACGGPGGWSHAVRQLWLRFKAQPRLPYLLPYDSRAQDALFFQSEHAPNPESRLVLSDTVDEFGVPRMRPLVRFSEVDYRTVTTFYSELDQALRAEGVGHLDYDPDGLERYLEQCTSQYNSHAHQLGTTRMSADPEVGVVDADCKVHATDNLYVCGSSVFPTAGHANPTMTILALALRLSEHLAAVHGTVRLAGTSA